MPINCRGVKFQGYKRDTSGFDRLTQNQRKLLMKSIRKTLVGILTITLIAGFVAQTSYAKTDPSTQDFLTGNWKGEQSGRWIGAINIDLNFDPLTQKISGDGNVHFILQSLKVYLKIEGKLIDRNAVKLNIHYMREGHPHDITYDLTYENGTLKGDGTSPKGRTITLTLKKSA